VEKRDFLIQKHKGYTPNLINKCFPTVYATKMP
jgi:hypothetical protein